MLVQYLLPTDTNTATWITLQYLSIPKLYHVIFFFQKCPTVVIVICLSFVSVLMFTDLYYSSSYTHPLSTGVLLVTGHKYSLQVRELP